MNSTPAASTARRIAKSLAAFMDVSPQAKAAGIRANNFGFVSQNRESRINANA
jgi:hypothetical protein